MTLKGCFHALIEEERVTPAGNLTAHAGTLIEL